MIFEPKIFYKEYLDDFHKFKAIIYQTLLENLPKYEKEFFDEQLDKEGKEAFRRTLMCDLRQTYFHSIETFFEIFFALLSNKNQPTFNDENILFTLTNSNWRETYNKILKIANEEMSLDFLNDEITFLGNNITIGHYIFYFGTFNKAIFNSEFLARINESIEAIKFGIKLIAKDFTDREEYNAYKHGLRIIPSVKELALADPKTMEVQIKWDLSNSMSFYSKTKDPNELKVITKLFDTDRDSKMIHFCSNLVSNIVFYRKAAIIKDQMIKKEEKIPIVFFGKKEIEDCNNINVKIQNLVYTIKKTEQTKKGGS